jgi:hypothetical protein
MVASVFLLFHFHVSLFGLGLFEVVSIPPLEPNLGVGEKRLILKIP